MPDGLNLADTTLPFFDVSFSNHRGPGWYRVFRGGTVERWTHSRHGVWCLRYIGTNGPYAVRARRIAAIKGYQMRIAA